MILEIDPIKLNKDNGNVNPNIIVGGPGYDKERTKKTYLSTKLKLVIKLFALGIVINVGVFFISIYSSAGVILPYLFIYTVPLTILLIFPIAILLIRDLTVAIFPSEKPIPKKISGLLVILPIILSIIIGAFVYTLHHTTYLLLFRARLINFGIQYYYFALAICIVVPIISNYLIARRLIPLSTKRIAISSLVGIFILIGWLVTDGRVSKKINVDLLIPASLTQPQISHLPLDKYGPDRYTVWLGNNLGDDTSMEEMKTSSNDAYNAKTHLCLPDLLTGVSSILVALKVIKITTNVHLKSR